MIKEQLPLFGDNIMELGVDTKLDIWYREGDHEADLHCTIFGVDHEEGTVKFNVSNGDWEGKLYPNKNLMMIGLWPGAEFKQIKRFEFYDRNYSKFVNKLHGIEEPSIDWIYDDVPF